MTDALNKQAFSEKAEMMLSVAKADDRPLLLLFVDIDGFKAVNDQSGHAAGDTILRSFAAEATSLIRRGECFGRIGGDEFAAVVSLEAAAEAHDVADAFHKRVSRVLADSSYPVTCSMGALIVMPPHDASFASLLREADQLMYAVKHSGKNGFRISAILQESSSVPPNLLDSSRPSLVA